MLNVFSKTMADHTISPIPCNQGFPEKHCKNTFLILGIFNRLHIEDFDQPTIGINISFFSFSVSLAAGQNFPSYTFKTFVPKIPKT